MRRDNRMRVPVDLRRIYGSGEYVPTVQSSRASVKNGLGGQEFAAGIIVVPLGRIVRQSFCRGRTAKRKESSFTYHEKSICTNFLLYLHLITKYLTLLSMKIIILQFIVFQYI